MNKPALRYASIALCLVLAGACAKKGQDVISEMSNEEVCEELMGGMNRPVYRRALLSEIEHRGISCLCDAAS